MEEDALLEGRALGSEDHRGLMVPSHPQPQGDQPAAQHRRLVRRRLRVVDRDAPSSQRP